MELRVQHEGCVDSTSERLFDALVRGSAHHGDVCIAREQTAGRGRRGAAWHSGPDGGLYLSILLLPGPPLLHPAALTIGAGIAALETVRALGVERARLKWPNDVVVDRERGADALHASAKLAGVLVETRGLDPANPHYVVGIGLNIAQRTFPPELAAARAVTSVALEGGQASLQRAESELLPRLAAGLERAALESSTLTERFLDCARLRDALVEVELGAELRRGRVRALELRRGIALERSPSSGGEARVEWLALEHVRQVRALERE